MKVTAKQAITTLILIPLAIFFTVCTIVSIATGAWSNKGPTFIGIVSILWLLVVSVTALVGLINVWVDNKTIELKNPFKKKVKLAKAQIVKENKLIT